MTSRLSKQQKPGRVWAAMLLLAALLGTPVAMVVLTPPGPSQATLLDLRAMAWERTAEQCDAHTPGTGAPARARARVFDDFAARVRADGPFGEVAFSGTIRNDLALHARVSRACLNGAPDAARADIADPRRGLAIAPDAR